LVGHKFVCNILPRAIAHEVNMGKMELDDTLILVCVLLYLTAVRPV